MIGGYGSNCNAFLGDKFTLCLYASSLPHTCIRLLLLLPRTGLAPAVPHTCLVACMSNQHCTWGRQCMLRLGLSGLTISVFANIASQPSQVPHYPFHFPIRAPYHPALSLSCGSIAHPLPLPSLSLLSLKSLAFICRRPTT